MIKKKEDIYRFCEVIQSSFKSFVLLNGNLVVDYKTKVLTTLVKYYINALAKFNTKNEVEIMKQRSKEVVI